MSAGIMQRRRQSTTFQQWSDFGRPAVELLEQLLRILGAAARQYLGPEELSVGAVQSSVSMEPLLGVARQYLAPYVGVVSRVVAHVENVQEIRRVVARRHGRQVDARPLQRRLLRPSPAKAAAPGRARSGARTG